MSTLNKLFRLSLSKTIHFNFHYFGWRGLLKLPVLIARGTQIKTMKGKIDMDEIKTGIILVGYPSLGTQNDSCFKSCIDISGKWIVHHKSSFARGSSISVGKDGLLEIGSVCITGNTNIICQSNIKIGNDCLISWGGYLMDTDFHKIYQNQSVCNEPKPIVIGNHVWIGMNCQILKGSLIPNGCVIGAGSIVTKRLETENCIYVSNKMVKQNIEWEA